MTTQEANYFAVIPAKLLRDEKITSKAKLMYCEITLLTKKYGYCFATNSYLAKIQGISVRQVSRIIKELCDNKYISVEQQQETQSRRIFIHDTIAEENFRNLGQKCLHPHDKNVHHNNININNINNNGFNIETDTFIYSAIDKLIEDYFTLYLLHYNKPHSQLTDEQYSKVQSKIYSFINKYDLDIEELMLLWQEMIDAFFHNVTTDGNINHFTEENILKYRYYEAGGGNLEQ